MSATDTTPDSADEAAAGLGRGRRVPVLDWSSPTTRRRSATGSTDSPRSVVRPAAARVGRARGDALAGHPGGRQDRPLRLRGPRPVLGRPDRPHACRSSTRSCSGATPGSGCRSWAPTLAVAGDLSSRHPRADGRVGPAVLRHARRAEGRRLLLVRARRRLRRLGAAHAREVRRGQRRVGAQRPEGLGHERRHRRRARRRRPVDRELGSRGHAASSSRRAPKGLEQGTKVKKHGLRASHTADVHLDDCRIPGACLLGGKEKLDERLARAREGKSAARPGGDEDLRGLAPDRRRAGDRDRPRRVRVRARLREGARAVRARDHREPGDRVHARRHEDGDRRRPAARVARLVDGPHRQGRSTTPRARCRS